MRLRAMGWEEASFALRLLAAGMGAYGLARVLGLHSPFSAVFSALIVARPYSEGAWRAAGTRLAATAAGIAVSFGAIWLQRWGLGQGALLFLALAPLSLLAAWDQSYRTALITVLIMLSAPAASAAYELSAAGERAYAVGLGAMAGVLVSLLVLPQPHARFVARQARRAGAMMLDQLRYALSVEPDAWRVERTEREVRKTLFEIGRAVRDHGKRAADDNASARIVGLTRYVQAALVMLRADWRKLEPDARAARLAWADAVAAFFAAPARQEAQEDGAELRMAARALEPAPMEGVLMAALARSLAGLKVLIVSNAG